MVRIKFRLKIINKLGDSENTTEIEVQEISKLEIGEIIKETYKAVQGLGIK